MKITSLADYFARTYAINLAEREDRRKAITRELQRAGMPLCAGKVEIFPAVKPKDRMSFPNTGVRGCFLSHLGVLKTSLESNLSNVLVIEDDLMISPLLNRHLDGLVADLTTFPWGIVYFGHVKPALETGAPRLVPCDEPVLTAHFYAVNGHVIPRLVEYLELVKSREPGDPLGGPMHLDGALTMFRQANPDVLTLIAQPNLGKQRPSRSNISCAWYERLPIVREAADAARVVRNYIRGVEPGSSRPIPW